MNIFKKIQAFFDMGKSVEELSKYLGIPVTELLLWEKVIPDGYEYKTFHIPKRNKKSKRRIDAPNEKLKTLQKTIYIKMLRPLKPHDAATGFMPKKSIVDAAKPHVQKTVVINIDLKDFFTSTSEDVVFNFLHNKLKWGIKASRIVTHICCYDGSLPQGAPTSPYLSNLVNYALDIRLNALASKYQGNYTRYADDLTFSFTEFEHKQAVLKTISRIIRAMGYEIQKKKKLRIQRPHQRQTVTGLVVNRTVNLPRSTRRLIRAMEHHNSLGKLSEQDQNRLGGYKSLQNMISPKAKESALSEFMKKQKKK
jgi:retron-type reverse transcriptase